MPAPLLVWPFTIWVLLNPSISSENGGEHRNIPNLMDPQGSGLLGLPCSAWAATADLCFHEGMKQRCAVSVLAAGSAKQHFLHRQLSHE